MSQRFSPTRRGGNMDIASTAMPLAAERDAHLQIGSTE
jgi:hypothetical protein